MSKITLRASDSESCCDACAHYDVIEPEFGDINYHFYCRKKIFHETVAVLNLCQFMMNFEPDCVVCDLFKELNN